jgi:hypothetical protein
MSKKSFDNYSNYFNNISNNVVKAKLSVRNERFNESQNTLNVSSFRTVSDDYTEMINYMNENYDAVVAGSDAIWNWVINGFPNIYFLKEYKGLKFSYAASVHGMNYQNMTEEQKQYLQDALSDFKYIGVRDITTERMVKHISSNLTAHHNCDPTMFLDLSEVPCDMDQLKQKLIDYGVDFSKKLVGIMAGEQIGYEIKKKYKDKIQLIAVYQPNKYADVYLYDLNPYEWSRVFSIFDVTLTHFFHGTMLSLVNGTPVIPVEFINDFSDINTTKIKDLMNRLDLSEWRFETDQRGNKITRALYKFHLKKDTLLWNRVFDKMDELMSSDCSQLIKDKVNKEAEAYNSFHIELSKYINDYATEEFL